MPDNIIDQDDNDVNSSELLIKGNDNVDSTGIIVKSPENADSNGSIMNLLERQNKLRFKKLLVPMTMRSPYWKYFGFPSMDGTTLTTKDKIVCALCKTVLTYNRNTTNLKTHLQSKHKVFLKNCIIKVDSQVELVSSNIIDDDDVPIPQEPDFPKEPVDQVDLEPGEILETSSKKYIIIENTPEQPEEMDHQTIGHDYDDANSEVDHFGNIFKDKFIPENITLESSILDMIITDMMPFKFIEQKGFRNLIEKLTSLPLPNSINVEEKVDDYYTRNKAEILLQMTNEMRGKNYSLSIEKWSNIHGKSYITIAATTIEPETEVEMNNVTIKVALSKINMKTFIVDVIHYTDDIPYNDLLYLYNLDVSKCISIVANYKDSSLAHLSQTTDIPIIPCFMSIIKHCVQKCINNPDLDKYFASSNLYWTTKWMALNDIEDYEAQALAQCLSPLKVIFDLLNNKVNTIPNSSVIKPLTNQLNEHFFAIDSETDSFVIQQLKLDIKNEIQSHIPDIPFLLIASFLDPRFTNILSIKESNVARQMIREKLAITDSKKTGKRLQVNRIDSRSGLEYFFASPRPSTSQDKLEQEFDKFLAEESCSFDKCPIAWWAEEGYVYPNLSKIATKYTTIPACIYEKYVTGTKEDIEFQEKRFLIDDCPEKLMYLYLNRNEY